MLEYSSPKILIIDDEEIICQTFTILLLHSGYSQTSYVTCGEDALDKIQRENDINIVLTDLEMPGLNGLDVLRFVKSRWPHIEVIIITGRASIESAIKAMKLGAYDYLLKPIHPDELPNIIHRCFQKLEVEGILAQLSGRIFLSYAREDLTKVEDIYRKLRAAGFNPWMDTQDLTPGLVWEKNIGKVIQEATFFFACISKASTNKRGMIQKEIKIALEVWSGLLDSDIYLIPIRLEDCSVPEPLNKFQWVDLFQEAGWDRLLAGVRSGLKKKIQSKQNR